MPLVCPGCASSTALAGLARRPVGADVGASQVDGGRQVPGSGGCWSAMQVRGRVDLMLTADLWWALLALAAVVAPLCLVWILLAPQERHKYPGTGTPKSLHRPSPRGAME